MQEMKTNKPCYKWASNSTRGLDRLSKHCNFKSVSYNVRNEKKSIGTTHEYKRMQNTITIGWHAKGQFGAKQFQKMELLLWLTKIGKGISCTKFIITWKMSLFSISRNLFMKNECKILRMWQHNFLLGTPCPLSPPGTYFRLSAVPMPFRIPLICHRWLLS